MQTYFSTVIYFVLTLLLTLHSVYYKKGNKVNSHNFMFAEDVWNVSDLIKVQYSGFMHVKRQTFTCI